MPNTNAKTNVANISLSVAEAVTIVSGYMLPRDEASDHKDHLITKAASLDNADAGCVCFANKAKALKHLANTSGVVCLISEDLVADAPSGPIYIVVDHPKNRFAALLVMMYPAVASTGQISPMAEISKDATLGQNVQIDSFVHIGRGVIIGDNTIINSGAVIADHVVIGHDTVIMSNANIMNAHIGNHVLISSGVVIGQAGFGLTDDGQNHLVTHIGRVRIGDHSYIGPMNTIDRGMLNDTVIGARVMLDSHCNIAHNVIVGDGTIMCARSGIAGSVQIGVNNIFGPAVKVADHVIIGDKNLFVGLTGVTKNVGDNQVMGGFPAVPVSEFRYQVVVLRRLVSEFKQKVKGRA
jgi:UDP-3-O-[3-hydroxymyristoyl] glucosamine N-acyltransferase